MTHKQQSPRPQDIEFKMLVRQLRDAQKEYFRTRDQNVLGRAKELERRVDAALAAPDPQRTLI